MIISCPNCGARYRLAVTAIAENTRMRCAACDHRWQVEAEDDLPVLTPEPVTETPSRPADTAADPEPHHDAPPEPAPDPPAAPPSLLLRNLVAIAIGGALTIAAATLWVARIDPAELPLVGDRIAALAPRALPLEVRFSARTTPLPSGDRLLEITGTVQNMGSETIDFSDLEARLAGPGGTVRRWRIAVPVTRLAPGQTTTFASTATGFPADATTVGIRPSR